MATQLMPTFRYLLAGHMLTISGKRMTIRNACHNASTDVTSIQILTVTVFSTVKIFQRMSE